MLFQSMRGASYASAGDACWKQWRNCTLKEVAEAVGLNSQYAVVGKIINRCYLDTRL